MEDSWLTGVRSAWWVLPSLQRWQSRHVAEVAAEGAIPQSSSSASGNGGSSSSTTTKFGTPGLALR